MYKIFYLIFLIVISILIQSCLEDNLQPESEISIETTAELLFQLESDGDYINSLNMPSLITAGELYNELNSCLVIDIRDSESFELGRIENAVNAVPVNLYDYINALDNISYEKIVIVSKSGQSASYYTCLLRLLGINNVYALKFGMASWNMAFADIWLNAINSQFVESRMDNITYAKPDFSNLPEIPNLSSSGNLDDRLKNRIKSLFADRFYEQIPEMDSLYYSPTSNNDLVSIPLRKVLSDYNANELNYNNFFIICYGPPQLYNPYGAADKEIWPAHPLNSVFYQDASFIPSLRSTTFLQTLPTDKIVAVYSLAGHTSAFVAAYLRVLGYNAKSIVYGGNSFVHNALQLHPALTQDIFTINSVMNFPYRTPAK